MINPEPEKSIVIWINESSSPVDNFVSWETRVKEILDPEGSYLQFWNKIFVISCVIAVLSDPLFFYIPIINQKNKCLGIDKKLRMAAVALRLLTDVPFIIRLIYKIRDRTKIMAAEERKCPSQSGWMVYKAIAERMRWLFVPIITHFLAIFPMPQLAILVVFYDLKDPAYRTKRNIFNVFLLLQYIPNVYRLHLSSKELQLTKRWVKGAFNFFMYILASHVLGGFWYFFSIQRVTSCWHQACRNVEGCIYMVTHCNDRTSIDVTFRDSSCPINQPDATLFDFGMFLNALQSGITESTNFPKKFLYSFWWGIRNLSSLGQNLETSSYEWENCFAILISVSGLLLFLYLIGNVQTYMQFSIAKSEEIKEEELTEKIKGKKTDIQRWVSAHGFPKDTKTRIMNNIRRENLVQQNIDHDVDIIYLFSILSWHNRTSIMHHLCMNTLKKVLMLQRMGVKDLETIYEHLRPVIYKKNSYVAQVGEPLDQMLFIIEGTVQTYKTDPSMFTSSLKKGDFYGEKLLILASPPNNISDENVICQTKVEAFALMAKDWKSIVSKGNVEFEHFQHL